MCAYPNWKVDFIFSWKKVIQLEGPWWVSDLDEEADQVVKEANRPNKVRGLAKISAWWTINWENMLKSL